MRLITHTVKQGDSLYNISTLYFGSVQSAMTIALVNNLDYPFIDSDPTNVYDDGSRVATLGDTIIIPLEINADDTIEDITENDSYGRDLLLDNDRENLSYGFNGEFVTTATGDVATTSGKETLAQDISHRLSTEYGTLMLHPTYGSNLLSIIGDKTFIGWEQKAIVEIARTILADPRVSDVRDISFSITDLGVHIKCIIITPLGLIDFSEYVGGVV